MKAKDTFHASPLNHNCAQAVAHRWKHLYEDEETVVKYAACGGGRAPEGCCGALYAAMQACPERAAEIRSEFEREAGATRCRDLKGRLGIPCPRLVELADSLLEKHNL